jgi:hypothetical protein
MATSASRAAGSSFDQSANNRDTCWRWDSSSDAGIAFR